MAREYQEDFVNGVRVPPLVVTEDRVLQAHVGSIVVEAGTLVIAVGHQGTLSVQAGAVVRVDGMHQGSVALESGAHMIVAGVQQGSTAVARGATLFVETNGKLQGSLTNDGDVIVRGVFGGSQSGRPVRIEGAGRIIQPTIRDGINYYEW